MPNISKINFNNTNVDVKDAYAREQLTHRTGDSYTADITGDYTVNAENHTVNAENHTTHTTGDYTINAGDISTTAENTTMHTTADREIDTDGNDSVHIDGASTLNVGGLRTEVYAGDKTESVTGTTTENFSNVNTTVTGKWMVKTPSKSFSMADVATETDVTTAVNAEAQARENADAALSARIDNATEKRVIIALGDSLGTGIMGEGLPRSDYGWLKMLRKKATEKLTVYTNIGVIIEGNSGFASTAPFIAQIKEVVSTNNINTADVTDIVIFAGTNDCIFVDTTLETALDEFFTYVKTTFKNASLKLGVLLANYKFAKTGTGNTVMRVYRRQVEKYGYRYIPDVFNLCLRKKYIQSDDTHLNDEGYKTIYPYILDCALYGTTQYRYEGGNTYEQNVVAYYYVSESGITIDIALSESAASLYLNDINITGPDLVLFTAPTEENILCGIPYKRVCPLLIKINDTFQIGDYYIDNDNKIHVSLSRSPDAPTQSGTATLMSSGSLHYIPADIIQN